LFDRVLIANRGEIAVRVIRACRSLGLRTVAVHSEADREAMHVRLADQAVCIGPASASRSYLDVTALLFAAKVSGAQAIHPGYGFLSENAAFAEHVRRAGLVFIGPDVTCIRTMGDKVAARRTMQAAGLQCVPGSDAALPEDLDVVRAQARAVGYPVILKASGGGGGRGMRVVHTESELPATIALTREEARRAFANPDVYLERFLRHPRHVEIQVLADTHGQAVWLGSRDCSLQRRHQKVVEEAPAPMIEPGALADLAASCVQACRQMRYEGVGTFEFLFEQGEFFFIEMNTRLQVEHPVTELTTGIDIVQQQIRVARGEPLAFVQAQIGTSGHAVECRINAEDPHTFAPSPGLVTACRWPEGPGVRVDTHIGTGDRVSVHYDSLVGKIIVHAPTRAEAIARMAAALDATEIEGIATNLALQRGLMRDPGFVQGGVDIHHLGHLLDARGHALRAG
jgi:acetyl-CoA carboxylase biotin carboxylase subunit